MFLIIQMHIFWALCLVVIGVEGVCSIKNGLFSFHLNCDILWLLWASGEINSYLFLFALSIIDFLVVCFHID